MKYVTFVAVAVMFGVMGAPAWAHHSYAPYDLAHPIEVSGTVKEFRWTNPHTWIYLSVPNAQGGVDDWVVEGPSITAMARWGWRANSMKPGDKVHLIIGPNKSGAKGGSLAGAVDANGNIMNAGRLPSEYSNGFGAAQ